MERELWFDVLVIGGGGAALRAALSADGEGADTALICKKNAGESGATYYSVAEVGAFNVPDGALDPTDSPEKFYRDMEEASLGTASLPLCRILAERAEDALEDLEKIGGGIFGRTAEGNYEVYQACFSSRPRSHVVHNHFKPILKALREEVQKRDITILNGFQAVELLTANGETGGVLALDKEENFVVIHARSVILAAGGASRLFSRNLYPADITGDGYAMAWRAGASLSNMEFIQTGIGVAYPFINLFGNYLWEAKPHIRNRDGEDVLLKYGGSAEAVEKALQEKTHFPFSTRDASKLIEISVQTELNQGGGTENGNVKLDFLDTNFEALFCKNPIFASMWKTTYEWHRQKGIDFYKDPVEIACFAHAFNGGVLIDENAESDIPGLYAAGENAAGPHGADRLGGNMSVTCQVFGKIAGISAARRALEMKGYPEIGKSASEAEKKIMALRSGKGTDLEELLHKLQKKSDSSLLIVRDEEKLLSYLEFLNQADELLDEGCAAGDLRELLELRNLVLTGRIIAEAAQKRKESRGSHYRMDYPEQSPEMNHKIIIRKENKS